MGGRRGGSRPELFTQRALLLAARPPEEIRMTVGGVNVVGFGKHLAKEFSSDDVTGLAAELSYHYFLALFPFFIFLAALGGFIAGALSVNDPTTSFMNAVGDALPSDARSVLETQVRSVLNSHNAGLLSFGIVGSLWASAGAMKSLMKALNRAYDVPETRPAWKSYLLAIGLVLASTIGILGSVVIYIAVSAWAGNIADWVGFGGAFATFLTIVRFPLIIALILGAVGFMYWVAPNLETKFKFITPGAVLFTVVWIVATVLFGVYVSHFGAYNKTYGTLGGVVVLLTWLYITNIMLLVGAEVNAVLERETDPEALEARRAKVSAQASDTQQKMAMEPRASGSQPSPSSSHAHPAGGEESGSNDDTASSVAPRPRGERAPASHPVRVRAKDDEESGGLVWALVFGTAFALAAFGLSRVRQAD
jgi:membrane protein